MTKSRASTPTRSKPAQTGTGRVLGIDPGFDRVGLAVLFQKGGESVLLFSECVRTNPKESRGKRLLVIGARLEEVIKEWRPESLAIETLFFNTNTTSAIGVAEARGVIIFQAARAGLKIYEYAPQAIKIAVTGYGKADKAQMENMARKLVKIQETGQKRLDDEIDAIAVGITHLATKRA